MVDETDLVVERYARRAKKPYSMLEAEVWRRTQEKQRVLISLLNQFISKPLADMKVLEIGCGNGGNLSALDFLQKI